MKRPILTGLLALGVLALGGYAAAAGDLSSITQTFAQNFCPLVRFFAGPLVWVLIIVAFTVGVLIALFGGRNALRWLLAPAIVVIVLVAGKAWIISQSGSSASEVRSCIQGTP